MKRMIAILALVVALGTLFPRETLAKPAYCLTALRGCYDDCARLYSWELSRSACYAGCLIGYAGCG